MLKIVALCAFVAVSSAGLLPSPHNVHSVGIAAHAIEAHAPAQYDFSYSVHDEHTGDIKEQQETRHGDNVQGQYSLVEPDGNRRVVQYTADPHNGFNAVVQREGTIHQQVAHSAPIAVAHHGIAQHAAPLTLAHAPVHVAAPVAVAHGATSHSSITQHVSPQIVQHVSPQIVSQHVVPSHLGLAQHSLGLQQVGLGHNVGIQQAHNIGLQQVSPLALSHNIGSLGLSHNVGLQQVHNVGLQQVSPLALSHNIGSLGLSQNVGSYANHGLSGLSTITHHGVHGGLHH